MGNAGMAPEGITELLLKWGEGDKRALDALMPIVYDQLRRLAFVYLRRGRANQTLQPTALVHEAYLRLLGNEKLSLSDRSHFFAVAATVMRNILVDRARHRNAAKRGGPQVAVSLSEAETMVASPEVEMIALDDALNKLADVKPQCTRIVEMRVFSGLTIEETAEVLGVSHATVERDWRFARAWLRRELDR